MSFDGGACCGRDPDPNPACRCSYPAKYLQDAAGDPDAGGWYPRINLARSKRVAGCHPYPAYHPSPLPSLAAIRLIPRCRPSWMFNAHARFNSGTAYHDFNWFDPNKPEELFPSDYVSLRRSVFFSRSKKFRRKKVYGNFQAGRRSVERRLFDATGVSSIVISLTTHHNCFTRPVRFICARCPCFVYIFNLRRPLPL